MSIYIKIITYRDSQKKKLKNRGLSVVTLSDSVVINFLIVHSRRLVK